jgi:hypothetical protein
VGHVVFGRSTAKVHVVPVRSNAGGMLCMRTRSPLRGTLPHIGSGDPSGVAARGWLTGPVSIAFVACIPAF